MKNGDENTYLTKDFYIACLLRTLDYPLIKLERNVGEVVTFVFSDPEVSAEKTIKAYWDRDVLVDGRTLVDAIHELKSRIKRKNYEND